MTEDPEKRANESSGDPQRRIPQRSAPVHPMSLAHRHALLALWLGIVVLAVMAAAFWVAHYVESPEFHERVRQIVIARLERSTGAHVDLDKVGWNLHRLQFEVGGLRIRSKEPASEAPLLQVERATATLKWSDLLAGHLGVGRLLVIHPEAHILVYKDGSTNLPNFTRESRPAHLSLDEADIVDGQLNWNSRRIRVDGVAEGIFLQFVHNAADGHYDCNARIGQVRMRTPQTEPLLMSAEAQLRLYRDRIEVPRMRVNERGWVLEASGEATDLNSPAVRLSYRAAGDAAELARLLRYRELKGGALQLSGQLTYRAATGEYASAGKAQASAVRWQNATFKLGGVNGGFAFTLDGHMQSGNAATAKAFSAHLHIPSLFATALGGTVHGKLDATLAPDKDEAGRIDLNVAGVDLERALNSYASQELARKLMVAGATRGSLAVSWRGAAENAQIDADLQVTPLARPGRLPVSAAVQGTLDLKDEVVRLRKFDAQTARSTLSAEGVLSTDSRLQVNFRTSDVSEVMPLVAALRGGEQNMPLEFGGPAAFQGTVQGRLPSPSVAGHLELHDLTASVRIPSELTGAPGRERVTRTHWDSLTGDVRYSPTGASLRNGVLLRGKSRVDVDAALALLNGSYSASLPIALSLRLQKMQAEELQSLAGTSYPVTGRVETRLQLNGTLHALSGTGQILLTDATAWGQSIRSASADVGLSRVATAQSGSELQLRNIVVNSDAGQLTGNARMNLESKQFAFDARGSHVALEKLRAVTDRNLPLRGAASFEAHGEGTPSAPVINGRLSLRNLNYNGQMLGGVDLEAVTHGAAMELTAHSNFRDADVALTGEIQLRGQMPLRITADLKSTKVPSLLQSYIPVRLDEPSLLQVHVQAFGEAMHPRDITADIEAPTFSASYGGIAMSNDGPLRLRVEHQVLRIEQFRVVGERGNRFLRAQGQVQLSGSRQVNVRVDGSVNLKLLETVNPNLMSGGAANLNLLVNGTLDRPSMRGRLNVENGSIAYIDFPNGLSDINGTLFFNQDRLQVEQLTARTGGGLLNCTGFLTYSPAQGLGFNFSANGSGIRLRYPEGLSSTADASLSLTGTTKDALLSGEVTITRIGVSPRFDFASYLVKGRRGLPAQRLDSPLNAMRLDVRIISTQELQVQTSMARLSGNADLRLRGTAARPVALGRVNLLEGDIEFNGTKYRLERGDLTFTNPVRIEPTLDMELSTRVRDYDIALGFHGPIEKLTTTYRSDPPLSSSDIISLLAMGVTAEEQANPAIMGSSQYTPTVTESASNVVLGQALNATVGSRVQKLFGVSRVKIDPNVGGAVNTGLARVTVEQQVSRDLTLTYISNLSQSAQEVIQFEYNLNKNVRLVGIRDETGVVSFDVVFRKRKK